MMQLVWRYLMQQRRRTVFTVVGIVLACALVSSLGIFFSSFQGMMLERSAVEQGTHHFMIHSYSGLPPSLVESIQNHYLVDKCGVAVNGETLSFTTKSGEERMVSLGQRDQTALSMKKYELTEGRLPLNETEAIVSESLLAYFPLGSQITGSVSRETYDPQTGGSNEPHELGSVSLTVVGVMKLNYGNSIITGGILPQWDHTGGYRVYGLFRPGFQKSDALEKLAGDIASEDENFSFYLNSDYLQWKGEAGSQEMTSAIFGTFFLLAAIILFAMGTVIRNSFSMSVAEKMSQFGTLRCIGASPGQIRKMMFGEAFFVWLTGLPLGLLLGLAAMGITFQAVQNIQSSALQYFRLVTTAWPFVLTALLSLATVLLCASSPARKAARVSAIEAVRGNAIFREESLSRVKKGALMARLFGLPGMLASRNIRRNKKRYRTTVFSVALSVTLFLCLSGFFQTLTQGLFSYRQVGGADFLVIQYDDEDNLLAQIEQHVQTSGAAKRIAGFKRIVTAQWILSSDHKTTEYWDTAYASHGDDPSAVILTINREIYNQLDLAPGSASYDELVENKAVLLHQNLVLSNSRDGMKTLPMADYKPGDVTQVEYSVIDLPPKDFFEAKEEKESKRMQQFLTIGGILSDTPWFLSQDATQQGIILMPEETAKEFTALPDGLYWMNEPRENLAVKALSGREDELSSYLEGELKSKENMYFQNVYAEQKESRSQVLIASIFVYGFLAVIVLICCVNLFNTVSANLQSRSRELAMMRAVGMDNRQFWKMLLLECVLYGVLGTLWGSVAGVCLQAALLSTLHSLMELPLLMPLQHILFSFAVSVAVCLLAGVFPVRRLIRRPIVEEIRSKD